MVYYCYTYIIPIQSLILHISPSNRVYMEFITLKKTPFDGANRHLHFSWLTFVIMHLQGTLWNSRIDIPKDIVEPNFSAVKTKHLCDPRVGIQVPLKQVDKPNPAFTAVTRSES